MTDPARRQPFYERINEIMRSADYHLIAAVIRKQQHKERYGLRAENPYDLALLFALERLLPLLEEAGETEVIVVAESRGQNEDDQLRLTFLRVVSEGTSYVSAQRFRRIQFRLEFVPKVMNVIGTQMADLAAYPIARSVLRPTDSNPAFDVIRGKFFRSRGGVNGLKIFP